MSVTFQNFALGDDEQFNVQLSYSNASSLACLIGLELETYEGETVGSIPARKLMDKLVRSLERVAADPESEYYTAKVRRLFELCLADIDGEITWC